MISGYCSEHGNFPGNFGTRIICPECEDEKLGGTLEVACFKERIKELESEVERLKIPEGGKAFNMSLRLQKAEARVLQLEREQYERDG